MSDKFTNLAESQLNGSINDAVTSLTVDNGAVFPSTGNYRIKIDDEILMVAARSTHVLTVERGAEGTTAASHADNAPVYAILTAGALNTILNGSSNTMAAPTSQVLAGTSNSITSSEYNADDAIVGGSGNSIDGASASVICGGANHDMNYSSTYHPYACFIGGGTSNTIQPPASDNVSYSAIVGGDTNTINGDRNVILGGSNNSLQYTVQDSVLIGTYGEGGTNAAVVREALIHGHNFNEVVGEAQFERHFSSVTAVSSSGYNATGSASNYIPLPPNHWATGTVKAIGVGSNGQSYHRVIHFAAGNSGFGASILSQTTTEFSYNSSGGSAEVTLYGTSDTIYASVTGEMTYNVKWFLAWEFVRLYCSISGLTS